VVGNQSDSFEDKRAIFEGNLARTLANLDAYQWFVEEAERLLATYERAAVTGMAAWDDYTKCVGIMDGMRMVLGIVPAAIEAVETVTEDTASDR
jgi:hypothetical protein